MMIERDDEFFRIFELAMEKEKAEIKKIKESDKKAETQKKIRKEEKWNSKFKDIMAKKYGDKNGPGPEPTDIVQKQD